MNLDPLPDDGAPFPCSAGLEYGIGFKIVRVSCDKPAIGLLPTSIANNYGIMRAVCETHRQFIEDDLVG